MPKLYIGLAGLPASGKSEIARILAERHNAWVFSSSGFFRARLREKGVQPPFEREQLSDFSMAWQEEHGAEALAEVFLRRARRQEAFITVCDAVRWPGTATRLLETLGAYLIYVDAPQKLRHTRALRRQGAQLMTLERFQQEDALPSEALIASLADLTHFQFHNTGSSSAFLSQQVNTLLQVLRG